MINLYYHIGQEVRYCGTAGELGANPGDVGIVTEVDISDNYMTYRVQFPAASKSYWHLNHNLEPLRGSDEPVCGWKEVALRLQAELEELKNALKTLSEG